MASQRVVGGSVRHRIRELVRSHTSSATTAATVKEEFGNVPISAIRRAVAEERRRHAAVQDVITRPATSILNLSQCADDGNVTNRVRVGVQITVTRPDGSVKQFFSEVQLNAASGQVRHAMQAAVNAAVRHATGAGYETESAEHYMGELGIGGSGEMEGDIRINYIECV